MHLHMWTCLTRLTEYFLSCPWAHQLLWKNYHIGRWHPLWTCNLCFLHNSIYLTSSNTHKCWPPASKQALYLLKYLLTHDKAHFETLQYSLSFLQRNVNYSHKLYLLLTFTENKHISSNLHKQEATMCKLSTICWITFFKQTLCDLLCEPWHCPVRINFTFLFFH